MKVKTMLFALPFAIENLPWGKDLKIKTLSFPLRYWDIKKEMAQHKKVQVGKDQEKAQSEKDSHSKNRGGKKPN